MRKRLITMALTLGLVLSAFAGVISTSASSHIDRAVVHFDAIYYPWVPHNDTVNGVDGWHGSITVQNITQPGIERGVRIWAFNDEILHDVANDNSYSFEDGLEDAETFVLSPNASQTLTPNQLNIDEPGSGIVVFAAYRDALDDAQRDSPECEDGHGDIAASGDGDTCFYAAPSIAGVQKQAAQEPMGSGRVTSDAHITVDGYTAIPFVDVSWGSQSDTCHALAGGVDFCDGAGYYASPGGIGVGGFDGHTYVPIVQTNDGWNTELYLTNVDMTNTSGASVDVTLITTDQQGYGASGSDKYSVPATVAPGGTTVIDVSDVVPEDWVGSAHITSEVGIVAAALRSKPETNMLMYTLGAPSLWSNPGFVPFQEADEVDLQQVGPSGQYEQYAPLVYVAYNGWNTGFSFVNNSEMTNTVTVTYYGPTGNTLGGDSRTISPQGQEFIYAPSSQDANLEPGFVGSAVFTSDLPFHVAIDQVKYSTGEAMSYLATAAGAGAGDAEWPQPDGNSALAMPLVMKGGQDGGGDTSGLQLFNANAHYPTSAEVTFYAQSGNVVAPSVDGPYPIPAIPALGNFTLYTLTQSEMSQGQVSSAVVRPVPNPSGGQGQIVGISNMVNYDVSGDGAVGYNMVNLSGQFRFPEPTRYPAFVVLEHLDEPLEVLSVDENAEAQSDHVAENNVTEFHAVKATVYDNRMLPVPGIEVEFTIDGPNANPALEEAFIEGSSDNIGITDQNGEAFYQYRGVEEGEDWIIATTIPHGLSNQVLKIWHPLSLDLDPAEAENPYFDDEALAHAYAVVIMSLGLDLENVNQTLELWEDFLNDLDDLQLGTIEIALEQRPELINQDQIDEIIDALGELADLNTHEITATIQDKDDNDYDVPNLDANNYTVTIEDEGGNDITAAAGVAIDVDDTTGVATITYTAQGTGTDDITVELDIDGVELEETAQKTWTAVDEFVYDAVPDRLILEHAPENEPVNPTNSYHAVIATLFDQLFQPLGGVDVIFGNADTGPNQFPAEHYVYQPGATPASPVPPQDETDGNGQLIFEYLGGPNEGVDTINAVVVDSDPEIRATIQKEWQTPTAAYMEIEADDQQVEQEWEFGGGFVLYYRVVTVQVFDQFGDELNEAGIEITIDSEQITEWNHGVFVSLSPPDTLGPTLVDLPTNAQGQVSGIFGIIEEHLTDEYDGGSPTTIEWTATSTGLDPVSTQADFTLVND